ncbi:hypothetical protein KPL71_004214 [Citrus sinensis]|uniref:Uncharacterized protein n=1 Tax=Citrus sinensis TaxID=2711 RepID=A0ACB8N461_CITSI|nr:hypothetical protein KPL71_004214 [Citrus sinensis]
MYLWHIMVISYGMFLKPICANPDCPCLDDTDIDEELEVMRRKKKKKKKSSYPPSSYKSFPPQPPPDPKPPVNPIRSCLMFSSHSYEESFPPLEKQIDTQTRVTSKPFVQSPITASGQPEEPKQYEAVLNWQTKNASAQNQTLQQLASFSSELQPDLQRKLTAINLSIADITLGKIFQMAMLSLDKICEQKEFFKDLMEDKKSFSQACHKPYLKIECKDEKKCVCPTTKKRHFQKHFHKKSSSKKPFRYFRKKDVSLYRKKKSNCCFVCEKRGHFARNCPHKFAKAVRLIQHLQHSSLLSENEDVESNFLEQSAQDDQTAFLIAESSNSEDISVISTVQTVNHVSTIPRPSLKMSILPSKFHKHVPVIGFIDTGADTSMIDPSVLPSDCWEHHSKLFRAVNGETFETTLITKIPIDEPNDDTVFALQNSSDDSDSDQSQANFHQQLLSLDTTIPIPSIKLQTLPSKFQRPIPAIGLIDTGAQRSMINPHILPPEYWTKYEEHFKVVNGKLFTTSLITKKPIGSHDEHRQLLTQFYAIIQSHGIMLSSKKSTIATNNIEFLDASDDSWGTILLEEINGKEHFIAYASGQFSDTQKHYHSVFKEILAVKNGIKKFEYHLIGHHFLIRMDSSAFPNILNFKGKIVPEKMLLRLKDWFSKYDFSVKHIKGSQNLIPDMLSRLSKPANPLTLFSTTYHFLIISMATSLPPEALTKKTFPFNKTFSSVFAIQEFARKALFRFFMKAYLVTEPFPFSSFHPENLFLTGLTLDPSRETTEDVLWYIWCLTVLYATKLVLPITPTLEHLLDPDKATSLTWTLLEWFSPIPWWRKKLQQLSEIYNLERMSASVAPLFTSVFIIHRPYFQHPDTNLFWTQDQVYEWFTAPHPTVIDNEIQDVLHNYLCQLNHQPPPLKDIFHTSLGPQHDLLMIPTPSAISKPRSTGSSSQSPQADTATKPSKVDKATQTSPRPGYRRDCPYSPYRGPHFVKVFVSMLYLLSICPSLDRWAWFSKKFDGRTEGPIILVSAPVSINPITGTGLWNLEGRMDILREGVEVEAPGSAVSVAINMPVMSAYLDSESVEVPSKRSQKIGSGQDDSGQYDNDTDPLVKGARTQKTDYKQVVEVWMVCRKVYSFFFIELWTPNVVVDHFSEIGVEFGDPILEMDIHLIKTTAYGINFSFDLRDVTGYLEAVTGDWTKGLEVTREYSTRFSILEAMCLEHDLGRDRVEEREIWDEDDEENEVDVVFVSMVEEKSMACVISVHMQADNSKTLKRTTMCSTKKSWQSSLTLSSLSICEDELWYMWCLTALYATKLVLPIKPVLTHLTTPEFSPDLLWTLLEWPYFQHPETRDYWTQDMAYEWRTYPHPYTLIHDTSVTSVLKAYLMELNNVPSPATAIHHTSIGPSHTLEIIPKTQGCTPGSSSSPQGILVMEQRPDYTNVLFQDVQDPWEDFQSLLHTENPRYTVTTPDSLAASTSQHMTEVDEAKYQQTEVYLDQRQIRRHKRQYEKDTGDVSPFRYPSTP